MKKYFVPQTETMIVESLMTGNSKSGGDPGEGAPKRFDVQHTF